MSATQFPPPVIEGHPVSDRPTPHPPMHRFEALDSLRGVCALIVVMFHLPIASHWRDWPLVQHGYLFVDFFFVLSGFVIAHAYAGRMRTPAEAGRFMVRRLGRVWPLHAVMLAAFVALELGRLWFQFDGATPFTRDRSVEAIVTNLLLIQAMHVHPYLTWNGPAWTISVEVWSYVLFAGLMLFTPRRFRIIAVMLALAGALIVLSFAPRWMNTTYDFAFPRAVYGFFLGCLLQGVWQRGQRWRGGAATVFEIATIVLAGLFVAWAQGPWTVLATLVFVACVWVFAGERGAVSRALHARPLMALGRWSFAIYMVHMLVITVMMIVARRMDLVPLRRIDLGSVWLNDLLALTVVGLMIGLAVIVHRWIETPAQQWVNRLTKPRRTAPDTA